MLSVAAFTALVALIIVFVPFVWGKGGHLASASALRTPESLRLAKDTIVKRFVKDEQAFARKELSAREWRARKNYLVHRYLDVARRLDYLTSEQTQTKDTP